MSLFSFLVIFHGCRYDWVNHVKPLFSMWISLFLCESFHYYIKWYKSFLFNTKNDLYNNFDACIQQLLLCIQQFHSSGNDGMRTKPWNAGVYLEMNFSLWWVLIMLQDECCLKMGVDSSQEECCLEWVLVCLIMNVMSNAIYKRVYFDCYKQLIDHMKWIKALG